MIPQHKIQDIRDRAADDIVDIIDEYVQLKRSGSSWKGKCPFHDENTASFSVSPKKQIYKCFGCGEGGDVVDFLIKQTGRGFIDVIKQLAGRYMIDISNNTGREKRNSGRSNAEIIETVLPGITDMKYKIRRYEHVFLVVDEADRPQRGSETPWLAIIPPGSRGQFEIIHHYCELATIVGSIHSFQKAAAMVEYAIRQQLELKFWDKAEQQTNDWLTYLLHHPERDQNTDAVQHIIEQIPDELTYKIYQQHFCDLSNF